MKPRGPQMTPPPACEVSGRADAFSASSTQLWEMWSVCHYMKTQCKQQRRDAFTSDNSEEEGGTLREKAEEPVHLAMDAP